MKMHPAKAAIFAAICAIAGCSIAPARMAVPPVLGDQPPIAFEGMGGGQQGRFRAGPYVASYSRSDTRLALFDTVAERRSGKASFSLEGPGIDRSIVANCRVRERTITISVISFNPQPMAYSCDFSDGGRALPSRFEVQEGQTRMGTRQSRRGEFAIDNVVLQIASVHRLAGSELETASPAGYLFEQDGAPVGSVELNGRPIVRFAPGADAATQRAVMLAATALAVLWDPANSALGREAG